MNQDVPFSRSGSRPTLISRLLPLLILGLAACLWPLAGCRSRFIDVTIVNQGPAIRLLEFDYPNASFGANALAAGAKYSYRVKVEGSGPLSMQFVDAAGRTRTTAGPNVQLGDEGSLLVRIDGQGKVTWSPSFTHP